MTGHCITQDDKERKQAPLVRCMLDYFPAAMMELARHSFLNNEKHNPGEEPYWARGKSNDHADCIARHLIERGGFYELKIGGETYKLRHSGALLWRAAALLQEELEAEGFAPGRASKFPQPKPVEGYDLSEYKP